MGSAQRYHLQLSKKEKWARISHRGTHDEATLSCSFPVSTLVFCRCVCCSGRDHTKNDVKGTQTLDSPQRDTRRRLFFLILSFSDCFLPQVCPVVLDEITGSSAQEVLSRLICYRETKDGESQPLNDTLILATCNPDPARDSVFPLTPELQRAAIVAEPLSSDIERERFIVSQLQDKVRGPGLEGTDLSNIKALVSSSQRAVESVPENERIGTISLRDSVRCASLMKRLGQGWSQLEGNPSFFQTLEEHAPPLGWAIDDEKIRVAAVACYVCYGMRVLPRTKYFSALRDSKRMEQLVEEVKEALIRFLSLPPTVVVTSALQDNILAILIAVSAKLPLLCLGDDGTSKTLSLNLVLGQMQGRFSSSQLLRSLMRAQAFHLQLSEASTAKHIVSLKKTVVSWHTGNMVLLSNPCV